MAATRSLGAAAPRNAMRRISTIAITPAAAVPTWTTLHFPVPASDCATRAATLRRRMRTARTRPAGAAAGAGSIGSGGSGECWVGAGRPDCTDGLTVEFQDWWFNVRPSNTEPLLRLNVEAGDEQGMAVLRDDVFGMMKAGA